MDGIAEVVSWNLWVFAQVAAVIAVALGLNWLVRKRYASRETMQTRLQVLQATIVVLSMLALIIIAPMGDSRRGQLLSFFGIVLSAAIALSSTTVLGNAMAGLMLRSIRGFKPGDYVQVGEHFGRVTEMDLLHTEIQTEASDLTTFSNIYLINNPYRVVRSQEGTIVSVQLSLGYDVSREVIEELLLKAVADAGLEDGFVQVVELGDFSVVYRAAGILRPVKGLIATRSRLRAAALDALHSGGVEIVSPNFMNTRALDPATKVIPAASRRRKVAEQGKSPDDVVFDKAEEAESLESVRERHKTLLDGIAAAQEQLKTVTAEEQKAAITSQIEQSTHKAERLMALITAREDKLSAKG
ncbi:MAG: mechanosensitive ion channel [Gammaproteobacteria bacterium]|nr:mechanosensitive ion channel [Gammaproteobacteria bacterium]NNF61511.1 mechanosensitive ion channel family protein [Gammaproteobacteria bacterium]